MRRSFAIYFVCFLLFGALQMPYLRVSASELIPYDNFTQRFLDPTKWSTFGACFTFSFLECVREIQNGQLRLAVRNYGSTSSNNGNQYGPSELHFINPRPIKAFAAHLTVRRTSGQSCPANLGVTSGAHAILQGTFFNSGSGNPNDDVQALLIFNHLATDPEGSLNAAAFMHWQGQFFGFVGLGPLKVGQRIAAQLAWDQPHAQFVASWTDLATGRTTSAALPYTMSDTTPAAAPDKSIGVRTFAPNCIGPTMLVADMEATFGDVTIGN